MLAVPVSVLFRGPALQSVLQLASTSDEHLEVLPSPFVNFVLRECCQRLTGLFIRVPPEKEVRLLLIPCNLNLGSHSRCCVGVFPADDNQLVGAAYSVTHLCLPVSRERLLHGPVSDAERAVRVLRLTHQKVPQ